MLDCIEATGVSSVARGSATTANCHPPFPSGAGCESSHAIACASDESGNRYIWPDPTHGLPGLLRGQPHPISDASTHASGAAYLLAGRPQDHRSYECRDMSRLLGAWTVQCQIRQIFRRIPVQNPEELGAIRLFRGAAYRSIGRRSWLENEQNPLLLRSCAVRLDALDHALESHAASSSEPMPSSCRTWANFFGSTRRRSVIIARRAVRPASVKNSRGKGPPGSSRMRPRAISPFAPSPSATAQAGRRRGRRAKS